MELGRQFSWSAEPCILVTSPNPSLRDRTVFGDFGNRSKNKYDNKTTTPG